MPVHLARRDERLIAHVTLERPLASVGTHVYVHVTGRLDPLVTHLARAHAVFRVCIVWNGLVALEQRPHLAGWLYL